MIQVLDNKQDCIAPFIDTVDYVLLLKYFEAIRFWHSSVLHMVLVMCGLIFKDLVLIPDL